MGGSRIEPYYTVHIRYSLHHLLKAEIEPRVATEEDIEAALNKYYGGSDDVSKMIQDITEGEVELSAVPKGGAAEDGATVEADAPIIKLVNGFIVEAFRMRASDIHLEPMGKTFRVRYRIDGVLQEQKSPPKRLQASIISRLKIQSNMSIAEKRIPQDGRIQTQVGGKKIDLRVSCLPTNHGESIVMRILDKEGLKLGLAELGFFTDDQQTFERLIGLPDGILLSPARRVRARRPRFTPASISSTGPIARSSRWKILSSTCLPASTRCRSAKSSV